MSGGLRLFGVWTSVGCECRAVWFGWVVVCGFMTACFVMGAGVVFVGCWVFLCVPVLLWCWALVVYVLVFLVVGLWVGLFVSHVSVVLVVLGWLILVECFWWFGGLCVIILLCYCLGLVSRWLLLGGLMLGWLVLGG